MFRRLFYFPPVLKDRHSFSAPGEFGISFGLFSF